MTVYSDPSGVTRSESQLRPTPYHSWNWVTRAWDEDVNAAVAAVKGFVDAERERRGYLPIAYAGSTFDADAKAQRNISSWQAQIAAGVQVPSGFVWRDANNVDHAADAAFINGLGAAITIRGTLLYQAAWAHKANIQALTTVEDILAYDITTGW